MATTIRTCDGDVLDSICAAYYGYVEGTVEAVYSANPGLASRPQPYAAGILVLLPDLPPRRTEVVQLWT